MTVAPREGDGGTTSQLADLLLQPQLLWGNPATEGAENTIQHQSTPHNFLPASAGAAHELLSPPNSISHPAGIAMPANEEMGTWGDIGSPRTEELSKAEGEERNSNSPVRVFLPRP